MNRYMVLKLEMFSTFEEMKEGQCDREEGKTEV